MNSVSRTPPLAYAPDLAAFVQQHGRLPRVGDTPTPWHYRGWLLPYVIQLHGLVPAVADRWGYHLRTLEAGHLLDEPIPQIAFGPPDRRVFALLHDWSHLIGWDCGGWSDFRTLLDWLLGWGLALSKEEPRLSDEVNEKLYRQVNVGPLLEHPYDLGEYVAMHKVCPASKKAEILWLREHHLDLLERALRIERNARDGLTSVKGLGRSFSWEEFLKRVNDLPLFGGCCLGPAVDDFPPSTSSPEPNLLPLSEKPRHES